jgi:hypothetical protein
MIKGRNKLIHYVGYDETISDEFYDLENDPEELDNRILDNGSNYLEMKIKLSKKLFDVNHHFFQG